MHVFIFKNKYNRNIRVIYSYIEIYRYIYALTFTYKLINR